MKMPVHAPVARRSVAAVAADGVAPQGCSLPKKILCGTAVAGCLATPNPVACILAVAPNCLDCL